MWHRMRELAQHEPRYEQDNDRPMLKRMTLHCASVSPVARRRNRSLLRILYSGVVGAGEIWRELRISSGINPL
jgi:hypothetical protein